MKTTTRATVITALNVKFLGELQFEAMPISEVSIVVFQPQMNYTERNDLPRLTKHAIKTIEDVIRKLGVEPNIQWNNTGTIFSSWVNGNTPSWADPKTDAT